MASFNVTGFDEVEKELLKQSERATKLIPEMLKAGADVVVDAQKQEVQNFFGSSDRSTGALKKSIKKYKVKKQTTMSTIDVAPSGKDSKGVRNAEKGFILNYGRSDMPARPFMEVANEKSEDKANKTMAEIWENDK